MTSLGEMIIISCFQKNNCIINKPTKNDFPRRDDNHILLPARFDL